VNQIFVWPNLKKFEDVSALKFRGLHSEWSLLDGFISLPHLKECTMKSIDLFHFFSTPLHYTMLQQLNLYWVKGCHNNFLFKLLMEYPHLERISIKEVYNSSDALMLIPPSKLIHNSL
jgi:hypothetical protein